MSVEVIRQGRMDTFSKPSLRGVSQHRLVGLVKMYRTIRAKCRICTEYVS